MNMNSMDFPDVRFNLADNTNTNQTIFQFHTSSNYPKSVLKAIGDGVNKFLISACPPVRCSLTTTRKCIRMHFCLHYVEMRKKLFSKGSLLNNMLWELLNELGFWCGGHSRSALPPARPHPA